MTIENQIKRNRFHQSDVNGISDFLFMYLRDELFGKTADTMQSLLDRNKQLEAALREIVTASGDDNDADSQHYIWIQDTAKEALLLTGDTTKPADDTESVGVDGRKRCKHGIILYENRCLNCERESAP